MKINIAKYPVFMKLGYYPSERVMGQEVLVSIFAECSLPNAEDLGDNLEKTIDYGKMLELVDKTLKDQEMKLIETAVAKVGFNLLDAFARISEVSVIIEKPILPNGMAKGASVSVSENFRRNNLC